MPISGRFYTSEELQQLLGVTKQRVSDLARAHDEAQAEALRTEFEADWKGSVRKHNVDVEVR